MRHGRWALAASGAGALAILGAVAIRPALFFLDDAWFYLVIGRNVALGHGSTFHGDAPTNGYHPLWLWCVAAIGRLSGGERGAMVVATVGVQLALAALCLVAIHRLATRAALSHPAVVIAAVSLLLLADQVWGGEAILGAALHAAACLAAWRSWQAPTAANRAALGATAGLMVLARLDTIFFAVALAVVASLPNGGGRARIRATALPLAVLALVVVPYLGWTFAGTGHLLPISGVLKSTFPHASPQGALGKLGAVGLASAAAGVGNLVVAALPSTGSRRPLFAALGAGALAQALYTALFTRAGWSTDVANYYVTGILGAGVLAGEACVRITDQLRSLPPSTRGALGGVVAVVLTAAGVNRAFTSVRHAPIDPLPAFAAHAAKALPAGAKLLATDAPGRLAWFSGLPVHAVDGLTQPARYSSDLRARGMDGWVADHRLTHVFAIRTPYMPPWIHVAPFAGGVALSFFAPDDLTPVGETTLLDPPLFAASDFGQTGAEDAGLWPWPGAPQAP